MIKQSQQEDIVKITIFIECYFLLYARHYTKLFKFNSHNYKIDTLNLKRVDLEILHVSHLLKFMKPFDWNISNHYTGL